jgi:hypothetical protein
MYMQASHMCGCLHAATLAETPFLHAYAPQHSMLCL